MPAVTTVIELPELSGLSRASDSDLEQLLARYAEASRLVDAGVAAISGEVARRSSPELGPAGVAQRAGDRTPEAYVARLTGRSGPESRRFVAAGRLLDSPDPWYAPVSAAAASGDIPVGVAVAITTGLGAPTASVSPDSLLDSAQSLLQEAAGSTPEQIGRLAREMRDQLEPDGVAEREARIYQQRDARLWQKATGGYRLEADLTLEAGAFLADAFDCVLSPKRGGPRFVDTRELARQEAIARDPRTLGQLTHDVLVDLVRAGASADPNSMFGKRQPGVRVSVRARDLARRGTSSGTARLEGSHTPVTVSTAERLACDDGYLPIIIQPGGAIDVGRAQRFFTDRQRIALAELWGGCAVEGCGRPPAMTEAHHIQEWSRGGATDIRNGILLCRHHHLLLHNNGWVIEQRGPRMRMLPPPGDPIARPIRLIRKGMLGQDWERGDDDGGGGSGGDRGGGGRGGGGGDRGGGSGPDPGRPPHSGPEPGRPPRSGADPGRPPRSGPEPNPGRAPNPGPGSDHASAPGPESGSGPGPGPGPRRTPATPREDVPPAVPRSARR